MKLTPDGWLGACIEALDRAEFVCTADALEHLVAGTLADFAERARTDAEYARELPKFVARVCRLFSREDIEEHFATPRSASDLERLLLGRDPLEGARDAA